MSSFTESQPLKIVLNIYEKYSIYQDSKKLFKNYSLNYLMAEGIPYIEIILRKSNKIFKIQPDTPVVSRLIQDIENRVQIRNQKTQIIKKALSSFYSEIESEFLKIGSPLVLDKNDIENAVR